MEPEGSLLCSQESSIGHYHEPDRSSPHHPTLSKFPPAYTSTLKKEAKLVRNDSKFLHDYSASQPNIHLRQSFTSHNLGNSQQFNFHIDSAEG
jgi:hypothetical protein